VQAGPGQACQGCRSTLPNKNHACLISIDRRSFGNVSNVMIKANELENATQVGVCIRMWVGHL
jgi:hypothetical protein